MSSSPYCLPPSQRCRQWLTRDIVGTERVLDVGCGDGALMKAYIDGGCDVVGVEIDPALVAAGRKAGLDVREGVAEQLPFEDGEFDRVVCSVVVPYTDERAAVAEWSRVLKPGGCVLVTYHGIGYGFDYLLKGEFFKRRIYGARMLANTWWYGWTGRRLGGFWGDTLCQSPSRLRSYYASSRLDLIDELIVDRCCGQPRFFAHAVRRQNATQVSPNASLQMGVRPIVGEFNSGLILNRAAR